MGKGRRLRAERAREKAEKERLIEKGILKPKELPAAEDPPDKKKVMFVLRYGKRPVPVIDARDRLKGGDDDVKIDQ